jgi:hypothetical protein
MIIREFEKNKLMYSIDNHQRSQWMWAVNTIVVLARENDDVVIKTNDIKVH